MRSCLPQSPRSFLADDHGVGNATPTPILVTDVKTVSQQNRLARLQRLKSLALARANGKNADVKLPTSRPRQQPGHINRLSSGQPDVPRGAAGLPVLLFSGTTEGDRLEEPEADSRVAGGAGNKSLPDSDPPVIDPDANESDADAAQKRQRISILDPDLDDAEADDRSGGRPRLSVAAAAPSKMRMSSALALTMLPPAPEPPDRDQTRRGEAAVAVPPESSTELAIAARVSSNALESPHGAPSPTLSSSSVIGIQTSPSSGSPPVPPGSRSRMSVLRMGTNESSQLLGAGPALPPATTSSSAAERVAKASGGGPMLPPNADDVKLAAEARPPPGAAGAAPQDFAFVRGTESVDFRFIRPVEDERQQTGPAVPQVQVPQLAEQEQLPPPPEQKNVTLDTAHRRRSGSLRLFSSALSSFSSSGSSRPKRRPGRPDHQVRSLLPSGVPVPAIPLPEEHESEAEGSGVGSGPVAEMSEMLNKEGVNTAVSEGGAAAFTVAPLTGGHAYVEGTARADHQDFSVHDHASAVVPGHPSTTTAGVSAPRRPLFPARPKTPRSDFESSVSDEAPTQLHQPLPFASVVGVDAVPTTEASGAGARDKEKNLLSYYAHYYNHEPHRATRFARPVDSASGEPFYKLSSQMKWEWDEKMQHAQARTFEAAAGCVAASSSTTSTSTKLGYPYRGFAGPFQFPSSFLTPLDPPQLLVQNHGNHGVQLSPASPSSSSSRARLSRMRTRPPARPPPPLQLPLPVLGGNSAGRQNQKPVDLAKLMRHNFAVRHTKLPTPRKVLTSHELSIAALNAELFARVLPRARNRARHRVMKAAFRTLKNGRVSAAGGRTQLEEDLAASIEKVKAKVRTAKREFAIEVTEQIDRLRVLFQKAREMDDATAEEEIAAMDRAGKGTAIGGGRRQNTFHLDDEDLLDPFVEADEFGRADSALGQEDNAGPQSSAPIALPGGEMKIAELRRTLQLSAKLRTSQPVTIGTNSPRAEMLEEGNEQQNLQSFIFYPEETDGEVEVPGGSSDEHEQKMKISSDHAKWSSEPTAVHLPVLEPPAGQFAHLGAAMHRSETLAARTKGMFSRPPGAAQLFRAQVEQTLHTAETKYGATFYRRNAAALLPFEIATGDTTSATPDEEQGGDPRPAPRAVVEEKKASTSLLALRKKTLFSISPDGAEITHHGRVVAPDGADPGANYLDRVWGRLNRAVFMPCLQELQLIANKKQLVRGCVRLAEFIEMHFVPEALLRPAFLRLAGLERESVSSADAARYRRSELRRRTEAREGAESRVNVWNTRALVAVLHAAAVKKFVTSGFYRLQHNAVVSRTLKPDLVGAEGARGEGASATSADADVSGDLVAGRTLPPLVVQPEGEASLVEIEEQDEDQQLYMDNLPSSSSATEGAATENEAEPDAAVAVAAGAADSPLAAVMQKYIGDTITHYLPKWMQATVLQDEKPPSPHQDSGSASGSEITVLTAPVLAELELDPDLSMIRNDPMPTWKPALRKGNYEPAGESGRSSPSAAPPRPLAAPPSRSSPQSRTSKNTDFYDSAGEPEGMEADGWAAFKSRLLANVASKGSMKSSSDGLVVGLPSNKSSPEDDHGEGTGSEENLPQPMSDVDSRPRDEEGAAVSLELASAASDESRSAPTQSDQQREGMAAVSVTPLFYNDVHVDDERRVRSLMLPATAPAASTSRHVLLMRPALTLPRRSGAAGSRANSSGSVTPNGTGAPRRPLWKPPSRQESGSGTPAECRSVGSFGTTILRSETSKP